MTAIDKIRAKFWAQMPARGARLSVLLDDTRQGKPEAFEAFSSVIHTAKGEAQLLGLEPCAGLLELADALVKTTGGPPLSPLADEAFGVLPVALEELTSQPDGGALTAKAVMTIGRALEASDEAAS